MQERDLLDELIANGFRIVIEPGVWRPPGPPEIVWSKPPPPPVVMKGPKYTIPFFTVSCEKFTKSEQELKAYETPITKILEENSVKDIALSEDAKFLSMMESLLS